MATEISLIDEMKLTMNDTNNAFVTDAEYEAIILRHAITTRSTYNFQQIAATGTEYKCFTPDLFLWDPVFDEESGGAEYTIYCANGLIVVEEVPHSTTNISVTAVPIDFHEAVVDCCLYLATHRAQQVSEALGNANYSPASIHAQLLEMAAVHRGAWYA